MIGYIDSNNSFNDYNRYRNASEDFRDDEQLIFFERTSLLNGGHKIIKLEVGQKAVNFEIEPRDCPDYLLKVLCTSDYPKTAPQLLVIEKASGKPIEDYLSNVLQEWASDCTIATLVEEFHFQKYANSKRKTTRAKRSRLLFFL
ncbi:MAG: hypothetical protein HXX08_21750 [Chloroflexi bacterium]|uniref:Uncharacterized protein n=1 Tax=Candidatus Chlorohelix allophototropha TaxID=3003348 RepID=A0A8T7M8M7_9CHLR|nr:hypothetical protein [Chloroflexota bacterium]WJW68423.1 hypothetical protein OZ401_004034 [Chloroflexota bacterium L227-S17]